MIHIAICEDNEKTLEILDKHVKRYIEKNNIVANIVTYNKSYLLQYDIQEGKHFDLILSDIEMPNIDGMKLASYIKTYLPDILIIFITSHLKYAIDAFELAIFRYVPKNVMAERLPHALEDAINMINMQADDYYVLQTPSRIEKISYKKILFVQREGKNSVMVLSDNSVTKVRKSLKQLYDELNKDFFVYIERGTIVNLMHIMSLSHGKVKLDNGFVLHPSQAKIEETRNRLSKFWRNEI